jgi:lysozyme family protein
MSNDPTKAFDKAFDFTVGLEGGYVNNPKDPGGETKYGISKRAYPDVDIKNLTMEQAKTIYLNDYWKKCACDLMNYPLSDLVFDFAVNSGRKRAVIELQKLVEVNPDGVIGAATIAKINAVSGAASKAMCSTYLAIRLEFMASLPAWETFGKGWARRIAILLRTL